MLAESYGVVNFLYLQRYERKRSIIDAAHKFQLKELKEKVHKT